jgi:hypothetical protein
VTDAFRAKVDALSGACGAIPDKETVARQVFIRLRERAADFLTACGTDWKSWVLMSRSYTTRQAMEHVVSACIRETADSREVRYCRLRLKVEYGADQDSDGPFR